ncbi:MAG: hypothetical protein ACFE91_06170 [Promethearchaeota archaeon]
MIEKNKKFLIKIGLISGIILVTIGLIIHSINPIEVGNSNVSSEPNEGVRVVEDISTNYTVSIIPELEQTYYDFQIYLFISLINQDSEINYSLYVLNQLNYFEFENGSNLDDLEPISQYHDEVTDFGEIKKAIHVHEDTDVFIVLVNNGIESFDFVFFYHYSITPITYFIGLVIIAFGAVSTLFSSALYFVGWKRYFIIGAGINIGLFLFGIANLPSYRINPDLLNEILHMELYQDFKFFYLEWIAEFKNGFWPYSPQYFNYIYGPLFILTIAGASYLPIPPWSGAIPIFLATLGTGVLIYRIVHKITANERKSTISMLLYFLNPFTIFYSSYMWLNPTIFVFFIMLSFYLVLNDKNSLSMVSLGIATLFKQFTIAFFPLFLILLVKQAQKQGKNKDNLLNKVKGVVKYTSIYFIIILLISIPFIIVDFNTYFNNFFQMHTNYSIDFVNTLTFSLGYPVRFNDFFLLIGIPDFITLPIAYLIVYFIPLGICFLIIFYNFFRYKGVNKVNLKDEVIIKALFLSIYLVITLQIFFPRGSYKFYLILLTPFISIFFDAKNPDLSKSLTDTNQKLYKRYFIPILISWLVFFMYRYVYFLLLIFLTLYYMVQKRRI